MYGTVQQGHLYVKVAYDITYCRSDCHTQRYKYTTKKELGVESEQINQMASEENLLNNPDWYITLKYNTYASDKKLGNVIIKNRITFYYYIVD